MELQLVSFEQAKALKELGFPQNIYTSKVYLEKTIPHDIIAKECGLSDWQCIGGKLIHCSSDYNKYGVDTCSCPVLELVAKWLRDEKFIDISIKVDSHGKNNIPRQYATEIINANKMVGQNSERFVLCVPNGGCISYNSYEEALSAGIDKAIEILKGI